MLKNIAGSSSQLGVPLTLQDSDQFKYSEFMRFMQNADGGAIGIENESVGATAEDWINDFNSLKKTQGNVLYSDN